MSGLEPQVTCKIQYNRLFGCLISTMNNWYLNESEQQQWMNQEKNPSELSMNVSGKNSMKH